MIGGTFAATYPDRIGSAVLMNCTASPAGTRQKLEYGLLMRMAGLLGDIRVPETTAMAEAIPGAVISVIEGVAHLAALEDPAAVNKLIEEFVFRGKPDTENRVARYSRFEAGRGLRIS